MSECPEVTSKETGASRRSYGRGKEAGSRDRSEVFMEEDALEEEPFLEAEAPASPVLDTSAC